MGLLERVSTLIRANINDAIDRAEDPEKMIKQVILDMENQYMQVKTQVAVSIADQHMLEKKLKESEDAGSDWMRKAERSVDKGQDDLARGALDRYQASQRLALSYREQVHDQRAQVEALKAALVKAKKTAEFKIYPGAPHGFHADYRASYRKEAAEDGWNQMQSWFKKYKVLG